MLYLTHVLVSTQSQKFLLHENLGKPIVLIVNFITPTPFFPESLGMLDESLQQRLKVCSELSFLRYYTPLLLPVHHLLRSLTATIQKP
jgi:hypothetical protein